MVLGQETGYGLPNEPFDNLGIAHSVGMMSDVERAAREFGRTVIVVLHDINIASRYADRICAVKDGRVVEQGDLGTLRRLSRTRIELGAADAELGTVRQAVEALGLDVVEDGGRLSLEVAAEQVPTVLSLAGEQRIQDVTCEPASLEDLFLRHYEEA